MKMKNKLMELFGMVFLDRDLPPPLSPQPPVLNNERGIRGFLFIVVSLLFGLFLSTGVSANFGCGVLHSSIDNMSSDWFLVEVFYTDNPLEFTTCKVSPEDKKYCCDLDSIDDTYEVGREIGARVLDSEASYFSSEVYTVTSGNGFDVFDDLYLQKIINVNSPDREFYVGESPLIDVDVSFVEPYLFDGLDVNGERESVCESCSEFRGDVTVNFGKNELIFYSDGEFSEKKEFNFVEEVSVSRDFSCEGCYENRIRDSKEVLVRVGADFSHEVSGVEVKEIVHKDFEILDLGGGELREYSSTHNEVVWDFSGRNFEANYEIKSPVIYAFPLRYDFRLMADDYLADESETIVYWFLRFMSFGTEDEEPQVVDSRTRVDLSEPYVYFGEGLIDTAAFFVSERGVFPYFDSVEFEESDREFISGYKFSGDYSERDVREVYFKLKLEKEMVEDYSYLEFYNFDGFYWTVLDLIENGEDDSYVYYEGFVKFSRGISLYGKEKGLISQLF